MKFNLLQNRFLLVMGVILVAYILFFYLGVYNLWAQIKEQREKINQEAETLELIKRTHDPKPTKESINKHVDYRNKLDKAHGQILGYYREADQPFEKWFEKMDIEKDGPSEGDFKAHYPNETKRLIKRLKKAEILIGEEEFGADLSEKDKAKILGFEDLTERKQFRMLQKRFWIQEKLFNAFINAQVVRCREITFKPSSGRNIPSKITGDLGIILPFEVQLQLRYQNIPQLIYHLTDASNGGPFVILQEITVLRVREEVDNYPELMPPDKAPDIKQKGTWQPPEIDSPPVNVIITGGVLDFDIK